MPNLAGSVRAAKELYEKGYLHVLTPGRDEVASIIDGVFGPILEETRCNHQKIGYDQEKKEFGALVEKGKALVECDLTYLDAKGIRRCNTCSHPTPGHDMSCILKAFAAELRRVKGGE